MVHIENWNLCNVDAGVFSSGKKYSLPFTVKDRTLIGKLSSIDLLFKVNKSLKKTFFNSV